MTKKVIDLTAKTVTFDFEDGNVEVFELDKCTEEMHIRLALHGASQKVGDSYAGASKADVPLAYAKASVKETIAQVYANDWRVTATGEPRTSDLAVALARVSGESEEKAQAYIDGLDDAGKKVLRAKAKIKAALATIALEKATIRAQKAVAAAAAEGEPEVLAIG